MHFDLKVPCGNCPFRRTGGVRLHPERAREIAEMMSSPQGATFTCHKTAYQLGNARSQPEQHCAGALIFAEKQRNATQMMRIAERLRIYDPAALMAESQAAIHDEVFDDIEEMLEAQDEEQGDADENSGKRSCA